MPLVTLYSRIVAAGLAVWLIVFYAFPALRPHLDIEDHTAEDLQSILLGIAFITGLVVAWMHRRIRAVRWFGLGVAFLAAIALADELSFGERIFGFEPPEVQGTKVDGVHDVVDLFWQLGDWARALGAIAVLALIWRFRVRIKALLNWTLQYPPLIMFGLSWAMVFIALFLDLHIIEFDSRHAVEEYFELVAAASLLATLVLLARHKLEPVYAGEAARFRMWKFGKQRIASGREDEEKGATPAPGKESALAPSASARDAGKDR